MIDRTRPMAVPKSTLTVPVWTPYSAARRAVLATMALARSALVGLQPWLRQVPPARSISMIATCFPSPTRALATPGPAWPAPITIAS